MTYTVSGGALNSTQPNFPGTFFTVVHYSGDMNARIDVTPVAATVNGAYKVTEVCFDMPRP